MKARFFWQVVLWAVVTGACLMAFFSCAPVSKVARLVGREQKEVKLTPKELQRLVYSSHVLTVIDDKPELEGALLALRELHRQNPQARLTSLVTPVRWALEEYRKEATSHTLPVAWRDEILGRYFLKLCEAPGLAKRSEVALNLLKVLLTQQDASDLLERKVEPFHAESQRLLAVARGPGERQALVESCMQRAQSDPNFAVAMDDFVGSQMKPRIALDAPPREILAANPALNDSPTMKELTNPSLLGKDGNVVITTDKLKGLFVAEVAVAQEAATTYQALGREISRAQEDRVRYTDRPEEIGAIIRSHEEAQAKQTKRIAASSASAKKLSEMALSEDPKLAKTLEGCSKSFGLVGSAITQFTTNPFAGIASLVGAGLQYASLWIDRGPSPEEKILESVKLVGEMISDLSEQVEYRFDRVDRSLVYVLRDLRSVVLLVSDLGRDVDEVRRDLLQAQASLNRLERKLQSYLNTGFGRELDKQINGALGYQARTGMPMSYKEYVNTADGPENAFYTWAIHNAMDDLASTMPADADLADIHLLGQLESTQIERNLNYIKEFLRKRLHVSSLPKGKVASLADWYAGANAYVRLAAENPQHFRGMPGSQERLDGVIDAGEELEDFFRAITFVKKDSDLKVNRELYDAILSYYKEKLDAFRKAVDGTEARFSNESFDVSMWRQWESRAPRVAVAETAVTGLYCLRRLPTDVIGIAAGRYHSLALRKNGTVVAWGSNEYGQCDVPPDLRDVVAVSAGWAHSLALKTDGTIVAWGDNQRGQCNIPTHKAITKICAGAYHSLALGADGQVIAWGDNGAGCCDVPERLAGVKDIASGYTVSLALKNDKTVEAWGYQGVRFGAPEMAKVLGELSDVAAIAAGYTSMGPVVAVKADGTVFSWPDERRLPHSQMYRPIMLRGDLTDIAAVALGRNFAVALKKDATLEVIGGSIKGTPRADGLVAVAAGAYHALALRDDSTLVTWGSNEYGQCGLGDGTKRVVNIASSGKTLLLLMEDGSVTSLGIPIPSDLGPVVAIASGGCYHLALKADGTVREWRWPAFKVPQVEPREGAVYDFLQPECWSAMPPDLREVVAIGAGSDLEAHNTDLSHRLALRRDGTVEGWGYRYLDQTKAPNDLGLAVAIAPGYCVSLALRGDGTVVGWGLGFFGSPKSEVPLDLAEVVAIARGYSHDLVLNVDGGVEAWGSNKYGQCNVPVEAKSNVVAIAAGEYRSLALKADGTVVAWGRNNEATSGVPKVVGLPEQYGTVAAWKRSGQGHCDFAAAQTEVIAMACGGYYRDSFLVSQTTPSIENTEPLHFVRGEPPRAVMHRLRALQAHVLREFGLDLKDSLKELTGAKVLLESVIALGLPETLDQDDVLRGLLFGSESLIDREGARALYEAEKYRLEKEWKLRASTLEETPEARLESFRQCLDKRLDALEESGTPEIPRMVGHTLLQLRLLSAAHDMTR